MVRALSELASWLQVDGTPAVRRERTRFVAGLFLAGAALGLLAFVAIPGWEVDRGRVTVALLGASVIGGLFWALSRWLPPEIIHVIGVGTSITVAAIQAVVGDPRAAIAVGLLYVWIAVFSGLYFRLSVAIAHITVSCTAEAIALSGAGDPAVVSQVLLTLGTCLAAVIVIATPARRLRRGAATDPLTGLVNRTEAIRLIEAGLARAHRNRGLCALLFIDLDYFKQVNDTHGHRAGDAVLATTATRMSAAIRRGDVAARLGGDEFVVFLESIESPQVAMGVAARLVADIERPLRIGDVSVRVGASVGLVVSVDAGLDADRMLRDADTAAYKAKHDGRGRVILFDEDLRAELDQRARLDAEIEAGLDAGQFVLHYQPLVDLNTRAVYGVEALIRWAHPTRGLVPPDEFIPHSETSHLIHDIGRWVLAEATRQLAAWDTRTGTRRLSMAVNISGRHLASDRIVADVEGALSAAGISADRLIIEVTETVLVGNTAAIEHLDRLHDLGVRISIDDFGTGFTSVAQLLAMPVDVLKIDRSFIGSADPSRWALVELMTHAGHTLGATVVAEGIETEDVARQVTAVGIECGQGFWYARPQPAETILAAIQASPVPADLPVSASAAAIPAPQSVRQRATTAA